jgi:hypothetical protein
MALVALLAGNAKFLEDPRKRMFQIARAFLPSADHGTKKLKNKACLWHGVIVKYITI